MFLLFTGIFNWSKVFADVHPSPNCIKLKWYIIFYADPKTNKPTTYHLNGNYRREGGRRGTWKIITGKDGIIIYKLNSDKENTSIYFLKLDENILVFTDERGKLSVGDKDFSYLKQEVVTKQKDEY